MADGKHSTVTGRALIAHPDTPDAILFAEIAIACPECGEGTISIPGHHLKAIRDLLIHWCDEFPQLTGGTVTPLGTQRFTMKDPGGDPTQN